MDFISGLIFGIFSTLMVGLATLYTLAVRTAIDWEPHRGRID